jgi:L-alanine-DL-glutamate epimerase-like enolase superfamily enzyme
VTSIQAASYVIPTDQPEADGTLSWSETAMVVVSAVAGGQTGLGWTYASPAAQPLTAGMLAGVVEGREAMDVAASYETMCRAVRNVGREGIAATAISAVDIALWDLKARILNLSLTAVIGRASNSVPAYGSGGFTSYDGPAATRAADGLGKRTRHPPCQDQDWRVMAIPAGPGFGAGSAGSRGCRT